MASPLSYFNLYDHYLCAKSSINVLKKMDIMIIPMRRSRIYALQRDISRENMSKMSQKIWKRSFSSSMI